MLKKQEATPASALFALFRNGTLIVALGVVLVITGCKDDTGNNTIPPARKDSTEIFRKAFAMPEDCKVCHPQHYEEWGRSMHAYAMIDPIYLAFDSIKNIRSNGKLGQFCLECHSPTAILIDNIPHSSAKDKISPISAHGVSCDVCHRLAPDQPPAVTNSSRFTTDSTRYGSITNPIKNSYHTSLYDSRYEQSVVCKNCHDMYTDGGLLIEKTYTEWKNSPFPGRALSCQSCHMKFYAGKAALGGPDRERVHHHQMVGVDIPLIDFPGRDETIAEVRDILNYSVKMDVLASETANITDKILPVKVKIINVLTGHSIPSGAAFNRQMWLETIATDERGDTLFATGLLDRNGDLRNNTSEDVKAGKIKYDSNLVVYTGSAYKHGVETPFAWEADYVEDRMIPAFDTRTNLFNIPIPKRNGAEIRVSVRLRFRAMSPALLRLAGRRDLIEKLPIFEMEQYSGTVSVK